MAEPKIVVRYKVYGPDCYIEKEGDLYQARWNGCGIHLGVKTPEEARVVIQDFMVNYLKKEKKNYQKQLNEIFAVERLIDKTDHWIDVFKEEKINEKI